MHDHTSNRGTCEIPDQTSHGAHCWCAMDAWHLITSKRIQSFISSFVRDYRQGPVATVVANLGSGGVDYGVLSYTHLHLDLAPQQLRNVRFRIMANIEHLPLPASCADLVLCVGEVLNFSSPELVIKEIARIAKPSALVLLEYESSQSLEFFGSRVQKPESSAITTFYNGREVELRVFNPRFISSLLKTANFEELRTSSFHIISALIYRLTGIAGFAATFAGADLILSRLPFFRSRGCNVIVGVRLRDSRLGRNRAAG